MFGVGCKGFVDAALGRELVRGTQALGEPEVADAGVVVQMDAGATRGPGHRGQGIGAGATLGLGLVISVATFVPGLWYHPQVFVLVRPRLPVDDPADAGDIYLNITGNLTS
jgi:hypothetical protein